MSAADPWSTPTRRHPDETSSWATARDHLSPFGTLHRIESRLELGVPDVIYCLRRVTGWIESKSTVLTLKLEQVMFAEEWAAAGGLCHMLMYADKIWFLFDSSGMRTIYEGGDAVPVVRAQGKFPLKEMLRCLSPVR